MARWDDVLDDCSRLLFDNGEMRFNGLSPPGGGMREVAMPLGDQWLMTGWRWGRRGRGLLSAAQITRFAANFKLVSGE